MNETPVLSIGIIFKNEARCLERCLKSLQPLRDALPCELIMADTGATDTSRKIAEKYADILFDFPWINDFSAARNAVMDRSSGTWYMTIDCDEWVDSNISGFVRFLTADWAFDFASVIIRNYYSEELEAGGSYSDFMATRLLRLSTGIRYEGTVHEHWTYEDTFRTMLITDAIFHHDGYLFQDEAKMQEKQERNMVLLRTQLAEHPNDLVILTQCIESSDRTPEQKEYLLRAMAGVDEKWSQWEMFGAPIYRHAVRFATRDNLPELEEWICAAEQKFPDSIFVNIEIAYFAFGYYWNTDNYPKAIAWGERYLQGIADYESGHFNRGDLLASALDKTDSHSRLSVATVLASGYLHENQPEKCLDLMEQFDGRELDGKQAGDCVRNLCNLHCHFALDISALVRKLWDELNEPVPTQARADQRRAGFLQTGAGMFEGKFVCSEENDVDVIRHSYTAFLPLEDKCELGIAAQLLETKDPSALEKLLYRAETMEKLPPYALYHALNCGVPFPLQDRPLTIEQMDILTAGIAQDKDELFHLLRQVEENDIHGSTQRLGWARGLCLASLKVGDWKNIDQETGLFLARTFARIEKAYLPVCYAGDVLQKENLFLLPPLHRFGWYCIQAFDALDAGSAAGYVHLLREGLNTYEGVKDMVEFLIDNTPELKNPSEELTALAEQIRTVLEKFSPSDPAVTALKQSEAYQKVAYLIEGIAPPIVGGLSQ